MKLTDTDLKWRKLMFFSRGSEAPGIMLQVFKDQKRLAKSPCANPASLIPEVNEYTGMHFNSGPSPSPAPCQL